MFENKIKYKIRQNNLFYYYSKNELFTIIMFPCGYIYIKKFLYKSNKKLYSESKIY